MSAYSIEVGSDHRFAPDEAETFMSSWHRVVAPDGSTVAYTPDMPTARLILEALEARGRRWDQHAERIQKGATV